MSARLFINAENRQSFIDLFIQLSQGLQSNILSRSPVISIIGGPDSGKSLIAEVITKGLDDSYSLEEIRQQPPQPMFFLEAYESQAFDEEIIHTCSVKGLTTTFYFASSEDTYNASKNRRNTLSDQRDVIIYSTFLETADILGSDLIVDIGKDKFNPHAERLIGLEVRNPHMRMHPIFQKFWNSLENRSLQWEPCELPLYEPNPHQPT